MEQEFREDLSNEATLKGQIPCEVAAMLRGENRSEYEASEKPKKRTNL